jgi:hypothetical protein
LVAVRATALEPSPPPARALPRAHPCSCIRTLHPPTAPCPPPTHPPTHRILGAYETLTKPEAVAGLVAFPCVGVPLLIHQVLHDMHSAEFGLRTGARNAAGTLVTVLAAASAPMAPTATVPDVEACTSGPEQALSLAVGALMADLRMSLQSRSSAVRAGFVGLLADCVKAFAGFAHPQLYAGACAACGVRRAACGVRRAVLGCRGGAALRTIERQPPRVLCRCCRGGGAVCGLVGVLCRR